MNEEQLTKIQNRLMGMRDSIKLSQNSIATPAEDRYADAMDQAWQEEQWMLQLTSRAMQTDLLTDIDKALRRVATGEYGYCEESGEPIDIRRLLANPLSRTTIEEQTRLELKDQIRCRTT